MRRNLGESIIMNLRHLILALTTSVVLAGAAQAQQQQPPHNPAMREACDADIKKVCADAKPGQPTMACVMKNRDKMSDGCKAAMASMRGQGMGQGQGMGGGMGGGNASPPSGMPGEKPKQ